MAVVEALVAFSDSRFTVHGSRVPEPGKRKHPDSITRLYNHFSRYYNLEFCTSTAVNSSTAIYLVVRIPRHGFQVKHSLLYF